MRALVLAVGFLTVIPVPHHPVRDRDFSRASGYYPLAGYLIGATVAATLWAASLVLPPVVTGALAGAVWLGVTGMLHIDGLVDSADAVLAAKPPAERLRIFDDVHVGAFGVGAGACYIVLLVSVLAGQPP
ncbi:MAG: adenosylcobinamide-GDP ribazoletransferase, partial [Micrococcales bacterium]